MCNCSRGKGKKMTKQEYESIQYNLSLLLNEMKKKQIYGKRAEGYEQAVLACKSLLSNYDPSKNGEN